MPSLPPQKIARVAIAIPLNRLFDYMIPEEFADFGFEVGMRIKVPFANRQKIGYLIEVADSSDIEISKLKPILAVLDTGSLLSNADIQLLHWASRYYYYPIGEVFITAFPVALRKGKPSVVPMPKRYRLTAEGMRLAKAPAGRSIKQKCLLDYLLSLPDHSSDEAAFAAQVPAWQPVVKALLKKALIAIEEEGSENQSAIQRHPPLSANTEQMLAIQEVCAGLDRFQVYLLDGVTGSGKTEVYMQIIQSVLEAGRQVLVLLPEITLTPQLEARFRQRFTVPIAISHSRLTDLQRQTAWLQMQQGSCRILLGTRSALFTPLQSPGLILLDEEHDSSFKQQEGFRFSARDVAIMRAKGLNIPILLGSATPSLESIENVAQGRYTRLHLSQRAGNATEPVFLILDIRNKKMQEGLSAALLQAITDTLAKNEQVLIFLNRRGFAPVLICHSCGWVARCRHCDANLVIHYQDRRLICHHCGVVHTLLQVCPGCQQPELRPLGMGTERVEKVLTELFPDKKVLRLDRDTTQQKGVLEDYLEQINQAQVDIILGTQMLAKGHHFPNVTLVALLDVDSGLFSVDYHAAEKLAQLVMQVAGRAGRAEKPGKVILQTRQPEHPLLLTLVRQGYSSFAQLALAERKTAKLPPFSHQALLRVMGNDAKLPLQFLEAVQTLVKNVQRPEFEMFGPVPAPMARRAGQYRYQLLFQSQHRAKLRFVLDKIMPELETLPEAKKVRWSLDVDPIDLY